MTRQNGKISFGSLTLVNFTTEERLDEIIAIHEANNAMNFNPHRYTPKRAGGSRLMNASSSSSARRTPKASGPR